MSAARIGRSKFISTGRKITHGRSSPDHDDLVFEESGTHAFWIQRFCQVNGRESVRRSVIIDPTLHGRFTWLACCWRTQYLSYFPGCTRNVARAGKQLAHTVVGIHWLKSQDSPTGRRLPQKLKRRKNSLLFDSAHRLHNFERASEDRLAKILQR